MKNQQTAAKSAELAENEVLSVLRAPIRHRPDTSQCAAPCAQPLTATIQPSVDVPGPKPSWLEKARDWLVRAEQRAEKRVTENFRVPPNGG